MFGSIKSIERGEDRLDGITTFYINTTSGCYWYSVPCHMITETFAVGDDIKYTIYESLCFHGIDSITKI